MKRGFIPLQTIGRQKKGKMSVTGFTLIEILLSIIILSILIAGIFAVLRIGDMSWQSDMGLLDLQQGVRQAIDGMTRETRQGRPTDITITPHGVTPGDTIQFLIPDSVNTIQYSLQNEQIVRQHAGTNTVLANNINSLSFCLWDGVDCCDTTLENCSSAHILEIQLRAEKTVLERTLCFPYPCNPPRFLTEQVRLRNE